MPIAVGIVSILTNKIPGSEGHAPSQIIFMAGNIKVYVNLMNGSLNATSAQQAAGLIMSLKL